MRDIALLSAVEGSKVLLGRICITQSVREAKQQMVMICYDIFLSRSAKVIFLCKVTDLIDL